MTPIDYAKRACLKANNGVIDWRYLAEWLNLYAIEATKRLDAMKPPPEQTFYHTPETKPGCYDGDAVE